MKILEVRLQFAPGRLVWIKAARAAVEIHTFGEMHACMAVPKNTDKQGLFEVTTTIQKDCGVELSGVDFTNVMSVLAAMNEE